MKERFSVEGALESGIFRSRWLLSPFYIGLCLSLLLLLYAFVVELYHSFANLLDARVDQIMLGVLSLIDLSLAANLVLIVIFSGYENFISKIDTGQNEDRPDWMGKLDFSGLKMKLIGSIVAISAISLLRAFMEMVSVGSAIDETRIRWLVILHLTFIMSGVLFAVMDWIAARSEQH
jgi:uncharacterized protein (TIGR00645 family)